ncbi:hypothetical protein [Roseateles oligotrophus]|nr:hypothetical protein [Roseateles oligotrophus]
MAEPDEFTFPDPEGQVLRCTVGAWLDFHADGFALLRVQGNER